MISKIHIHRTDSDIDQPVELGNRQGEDLRYHRWLFIELLRTL